MKRSCLALTFRPTFRRSVSFAATRPTRLALGLAMVAGAFSTITATPPAVRAQPELRSAPPATELPTQEDIHQAFDSGDYQKTLQQLTRVLALKGVPAQGYDRHDLLRLKAETQLRLKNHGGAMQTLDEAAKAAPDLNTAAVDLATQLLIRRSQGGVYTPQNRGGGKPPAPIAITDIDQRKAAFTALFREELTADAPRVKASVSAKTLPAFLEVMPVISSLHNLEVAATDGKAEETKKLIAEPAKTAESLMTTAVEDLKTQVDAIEKSANKLVTSYESKQVAPGPRGVMRYTVEHKQGLTARDQAALRNIGGAYEKIYTTSQELALILGPDGGPLNVVKASAEKAGRRAEQVLKATY